MGLPALASPPPGNPRQQASDPVSAPLRHEFAFIHVFLMPRGPAKSLLRRLVSVLVSRAPAASTIKNMGLMPGTTREGFTVRATGNYQLQSIHEWRLDKLQNFLIDWFAALGIGEPETHDVAG